MTVSCTPPSGSTFPLATTTVRCTATDSHGNTAAGSFAANVNDTTPPVVTVPPDVTIRARGRRSVIVYSYTASATDTVDGAVPVACTPLSGSTFPLGVTTVTCTASDAHGNAGSASFRVRVRGFRWGRR